MEGSRLTLTLLLLSQLLCPSLTDDWCSVKCGNLAHIRCKYQLRTHTSKCKVETGLSPEDRMNILDAHNIWRNYVASGLGMYREDGHYWVINPIANMSLIYDEDLNQTLINNREYRKQFYIWQDPAGQAADMRQLVWDYDLERNAAIWASQCEVNSSFEGYHCAGTEKFEHVHMNMEETPKEELTPYLVMTSYLFFITYVDNAYLGNRIKIVRSYSPGIWDPYYAMIFSETTALGCSKGVCYCDRDPLPWGDAPGAFTCIYGPSFDKTKHGYKIYSVDKTHCSKCPPGTSCKADSKYKYLCARPDDPKQPVPIPAAGAVGFLRCLPNAFNLACYASAILFLSLL